MQNFASGYVQLALSLYEHLYHANCDDSLVHYLVYDQNLLYS